MKLKNIIIVFIFILSLTSLIYFSIDTITSISNSIELYTTKVFPSLFLFVLFTELLLSSKYIDILSQTLSFIPKFFKLPSTACLPIILGFFCGFPSASKAIENLYSKKLLSKKDCYFLMSFCNNASPIFIISTVGCTILQNKTTGLILYIIHIFSSILIGLIYVNLCNKYIIQEKSLNLKYSHKIMPQNTAINISKSILNSFKTMLMILAYMLLFNVLADILNNYIPYFDFKYITSTLELTKGIASLEGKNLPFISFLLGFSSFSILFQIKSTLINLDYPTSKLLLFKFLHGILSYLLASIIF